jgi:hypothetical protein
MVVRWFTKVRRKNTMYKDFVLRGPRATNHRRLRLTLPIDWQKVRRGQGEAKCQPVQ